MPGQSLKSEENLILVPVSAGELIDKITILELKRQYCKGISLANVQYELHLLLNVLDNANANYSCANNGKQMVDPELTNQLQIINTELWHTENKIREHGENTSFDGDFIQLAKQVYKLNDERHKLKMAINLSTGSSIIEEKSYDSASKSIN